ncbi:IS5/IS1182 family transposase [Streptomyces thermolineatus]|uniref:IS5/IS1182 family transposase n=1 Tax=Streptomyces thermolineatus TaxID=44033 RepID=A0ABP6A7T1_9ACTN
MTLIVTREGGCRYKLRSSQRTLVAFVHLREQATLAKIAVGFGTSEATVHACAHSVIKHLVAKASSLLLPLHWEKSEYVLVDGTIAECDRAGDTQADYSGKTRRHGINVQTVTDLADRLIRYSLVLPGRNVETTAARTHRIVTVCEYLRILTFADKAYGGANSTSFTFCKRHCGREPTPHQTGINKTHSRLHSPV